MEDGHLPHTVFLQACHHGSGAEGHGSKESEQRFDAGAAEDGSAPKPLTSLSRRCRAWSTRTSRRRAKSAAAQIEPAPLAARAGRGRPARNGTGTAARSSQEPAAKRPRGEDRGSSETASLASGKTKKSASEESRLLDQSQRWAKMLSIPKALVGVSMKNPVYQAKRTLDQINDPSDPNYIELQDAREACLAAEKLSNLSASSKAERLDLLEHVTSYYSAELPPQFKVNLLLQVLHENALLNDGDVKAWVDMCVPMAGPAGCALERKSIDSPLRQPKMHRIWKVSSLKSGG